MFSMEYDLEMDRVIKEIKNGNAKRVCIQLADGLKPKAAEIQVEIENKTDCQLLIWAGSCFGACDVPLELETLGVDMLIQFGHSEWR